MPVSPYQTKTINLRLHGSRKNSPGTQNSEKSSHTSSSNTRAQPARQAARHLIWRGIIRAPAARFPRGRAAEAGLGGRVCVLSFSLVHANTFNQLLLLLASAHKKSGREKKKNSNTLCAAAAVARTRASYFASKSHLGNIGGYWLLLLSCVFAICISSSHWSEGTERVL